MNRQRLLVGLVVSVVLCLSAALSTAIAAPDLEVSSNSIDFGEVSSTISDTSIYVYNAGDGCFEWNTASTEECWLTVKAASGSDSTTCDEYDYLEIKIDPSCLGASGPQSGSFRVVRLGDPTDIETISVSFEYQAPSGLEANKTTVNLGVIDEPTSDTSVYLYNAGTGSIDWTVTESVAWLTVDPMSGTTSTEQDTLTITADPTGLTVGQVYSDSFTVTNDADPSDDETITVTFEYQLIPDLEVNKNSVDFGATADPVSDTSVYVYNAGTGSFNWTVSESVSWLTVDPMSGTTSTEDDTLTISVDPAGLKFGESYTDSFTVSRNGAPEDSETVTVSFIFADFTAILLGETPPYEGQASGSISQSGEEMWYYFDVPADEGGIWTMWTVVTKLNTVLSLHTAFGEPALAENIVCDVPDCDLDHSDLHSRIDWELTGGTRYYLKVRAMGAATGGFTVKVHKSEIVPDNIPPVLTDATLDPVSGDETTTFTFTVHYSDEDADPAVTRYVYIDGTSHVMTLQSGTEDDGTYQYQIAGADLGIGTHSYYFYFTDGRGGATRLPVTGTSPGPTVLIEFPDVPADHWAYDEVVACVVGGVVGGYDDGLYHPELPVSRDQMAVFMCRAEVGGEAYVPDGPAQATFNDVGTGYWAYKYVEYCVDEGIVAGYDPVTYAPTVVVTRDQMAVYIARALAGGESEVPYGPIVPHFYDVTGGHWAYNHVEYCYQLGVVQGYDDNLYHPEYTVTRDQMAVYIVRAYGLTL